MQIELKEQSREGSGTSATATFYIYVDKKVMEDDIFVTANKETATLHVHQEYADFTLQELERLVMEMRKQSEKIKYAH